MRWNRLWTWVGRREGQYSLQLISGQSCTFFEPLSVWAGSYARPNEPTIWHKWSRPLSLYTGLIPCWETHGRPALSLNLGLSDMSHASETNQSFTQDHMTHVTVNLASCEFMRELNTPQRSLPTPNILWFCDSVKLHSCFQRKATAGNLWSFDVLLANTIFYNTCNRNAVFKPERRSFGHLLLHCATFPCTTPVRMPESPQCLKTTAHRQERREQGYCGACPRAPRLQAERSQYPPPDEQPPPVSRQSFCHARTACTGKHPAVLQPRCRGVLPPLCPSRWAGVTESQNGRGWKGPLWVI